MLPGMRDTAAMAPLAEALPAGASSKRCQAATAYQTGSFT
jgi:hypothetical protein